MQWILATIAAFGALIAYFQWRTAHQRVVLDLFDRRFRVYEDLRKAVGPIVAHGKASQEDEATFLDARQRAQFLFGDDVVQYLDGLWEDICHLSLPEPTPMERDREAIITKRYEHFRNLSDFFKRARELFEPYMRLDQRLPSLWSLGRVGKWTMGRR